MRCLARAAHIDCHPSCSRNHNKHTNWIWNRREEQIKNWNVENLTKPLGTRETRTVCIWREIVKFYLCVAPPHLCAGYSFHVHFNHFFSFYFSFLNFLFILFFEIRKNGAQTLTHSHSDDKHPTTQQMENVLPLASLSANNHKFVMRRALVCTFTDLNVNTAFERHLR